MVNMTNLQEARRLVREAAEIFGGGSSRTLSARKIAPIDLDGLDDAITDVMVEAVQSPMFKKILKEWEFRDNEVVLEKGVRRSGSSFEFSVTLPDGRRTYTVKVVGKGKK